MNGRIEELLSMRVASQLLQHNNTLALVDSRAMGVNEGPATSAFAAVQLEALLQVGSCAAPAGIRSL